MPDNINERIARWMGEYSSKAVRDFHGSDIGRAYTGPEYDTDPAAALRVLARMNLEQKPYGLGYLLSAHTDETWFVCCFDYKEDEWREKKHKAPTPCAAICAAWAAKFGGGHE